MSIAFGLLALATLTVATRWWRLLIVHDCPTRWRDAVRFTYVGLFFNVVGPGFNGGDVARAVAVVQRHPSRRPEALMSVVVDRVLGLVSMVVIGACFVLTPGDRAADLRLPVSAAAAAFCWAERVLQPPHPGLGPLRGPDGPATMGDRLERMDARPASWSSDPASPPRPGPLQHEYLLTGTAVSFIAAGLENELGFGEWMSTTAIASTIPAFHCPGGLVVGHLFGALAAIFGSTYAMEGRSALFRVGLYGLCSREAGAADTGRPLERRGFPGLGAVNPPSSGGGPAGRGSSGPSGGDLMNTRRPSLSPLLLNTMSLAVIGTLAYDSSKPPTTAARPWRIRDMLRCGRSPYSKPRLVGVVGGDFKDDTRCRERGSAWTASSRSARERPSSGVAATSRTGARHTTYTDLNVLEDFDPGCRTRTAIHGSCSQRTPTRSIEGARSSPRSRWRT